MRFAMFFYQPFKLCNGGFANNKQPNPHTEPLLSLAGFFAKNTTFYYPFWRNFFRWI